MVALAPRISVIMPAHNVAPYVGEALASLHAQTTGDFEVLAIDDGSSDATAAIIESWIARFADIGIALTLLGREQGGAGAARNDGLDLARGEFLCFLDADDRLQPSALRALADRLSDDHTLDFIFPLCRHIDETGRSLDIISTADKPRYSACDLVFENPIHSGTGVMLRRSCAEAAGRFDTQLPACIDLDYWVRVTRRRTDNISALQHVMVDYRTRPGQITGDWRRMRRGWEALMVRAETAGISFKGKARSEVLARNALVWSTAAYKHGELASARQLAWELWRNDVVFALSNRHARIRIAACLTSLLPAPIHRWIKSRFNTRY